MYYVNGHYVKEEDAKISILDLAILRGFGVFDFLRTYKGRPFHLWDHLLRLQYSAEHIGLALPHSLEEIEQIAHTVQKLNNLSEASIKILVTGGVSADQFTPHPQNNLIVFAYPLNSYPAHYYSEGIKVITTRLNRSLPTSKTTQYTPAIVAMQRGRAQNAQEALYINAKDEILEATTSNFFAFKNGTLYTCCSEEVLIGITREVVRKLAAPYYPIETRALQYSEIAEIDEAFITASNKEVMPVIQIDSTKVGNGKVGEKTKHLMDLFRAYTLSADWPVLNIPRYTEQRSRLT
ncbi:MAG: aminotransferase class IV [Verrucomicrobia bacterium]|nr:aminotransferase class IV [Verrucomicrobiota bacterium]